MCDVIIPALLGVAALGLLGGGVGGNCVSCEPAQACSTVGNKTITIPQLAGEGINAQYASAGNYGYQQQAAPQYAPAPGPQYAPAPGPQYGAPAPQYGAPAGYGAPAPGYDAPPAPGFAARGSFDAPAPAESSAGAYLNPGAGEAGVNVGGVGAGVDFSGPRSY